MEKEGLGPLGTAADNEGADIAIVVPLGGSGGFCHVSAFSLQT